MPVLNEEHRARRIISWVIASVTNWVLSIDIILIWAEIIMQLLRIG